MLILISFLKGGSLPCVGLTELPKCPVCLERMVSRLDDFLSGFHVMSSPLKLSVEGDKVSQFLIPSVLSIIIANFLSTLSTSRGPWV